MQKHLSEHVRDLMRKARESAGFRFTATPVASKTKKIPAVIKEATRVSPVRKPKEKQMKIKLQAPSKKITSPTQTTTLAKATRGLMKKSSQTPSQTKSPRQTRTIKEEPSPVKKESVAKRKRRSAVAVDGEDENVDATLISGIEVAPEEVTVKEKWLKLYHDKYRAVDEARFRAIQVRPTFCL